MVKNFIKHYASNFLAVFVGMLALSMIQFSNVFANIKQEQENISQQKIMVTFKPDVAQKESDKIIKENINNEALQTAEHLKVKVQTTSQIHRFLKDNHIKVDTGNIGTGYIVTNFKSDKDFDNYAKTIKQQKGVALAETNKIDNSVNNTQHNDFIYIIAVIIVLVGLTFTLLYQKNKKTQELTLLILNGKNDKDLIVTNTFIIAIASILISGLALLLTSLGVSIMTHSFDNHLLLQTNYKLLVTALIIDLYNTVFYFLNTKFTFKRKTTW